MASTDDTRKRSRSRSRERDDDNWKCPHCNELVIPSEVKLGKVWSWMRDGTTGWGGHPHDGWVTETVEDRGVYQDVSEVPIPDICAVFQYARENMNELQQAAVDAVEEIMNASDDDDADDADGKDAALRARVRASWVAIRDLVDSHMDGLVFSDVAYTVSVSVAADDKIAMYKLLLKQYTQDTISEGVNNRHLDRSDVPAGVFAE